MKRKNVAFYLKKGYATWPSGHEKKSLSAAELSKTRLLDRNLGFAGFGLVAILESSSSDLRVQGRRVSTA